MSGRGVLRFKRWKAKTEPDTVYRLLQLTREVAVEQQSEYQVELAKLNEQVKKLIGELGVPSIYHHYYIHFAQGLWYLKKRFNQSGNTLEAEAVAYYWLLRGLDKTALQAVAKLLGFEVFKRIRIGVEAVPTTYVYTSDPVSVLNTSKQLKAEAKTTKQYLDPSVVTVIYDNPSGSGVTLYVELALLYNDGTESPFKTLSIAEGVSDKATILSEDIYDNVLDDKKITGIRLYAYVSATPSPGLEPVVQLDVRGKEFG